MVGMRFIVDPDDSDHAGERKDLIGMIPEILSQVLKGCHFAQLFMFHSEIVKITR